jgi:hypothetical protein
MRKLLLFYFIFLVVVLCLPKDLLSQQFGGNPPSVKWKQINTDSVRIIFPAGLDSQAQRVSSIVHYLAAHTSGTSLSLGNGLHKINIVLQNQTTIANAYVGLGPFRSEFFLTPAMNNFDQGSIPWGDQLAVHEYRHVMQFNNFHNGLSEVMYRLFGDDGFSLAINASIPDWFYEGDAVYNETIFTNQGRGRLPLFMNAYPAMWQSGIHYSWMKLRNGSYKDYVPNHYYLGYMLVNYGREKYGADFWTKVTKDASAYKGLFYPFQKAITRYAGVDYKTFRNNAFDYYKSPSQTLPGGEGFKNTPKEAKPELQKLNGASQGTINQGPLPTGRQAGAGKTYLFPVNKKYVTSYYFPYQVGNDSLLYLKASFRHRPAFYIKDAAGEHKLKVRDISIDEQFSYRHGKIVYAAYENDARWSWRDYSVIKIMDVQTGEEHTLTHKSKYFTPDISADGTKIAAVQVATNGKSELHIIDAANGQVLKVLRSADVILFTDPKFIDANSLVTAVRLKDGKMALAEADLQSGSIVRLTNPSFNVVGYPCVNNGIIYFTASYGGNDDVFALRLNDNKIYKISNGPQGNYFVNAGNGKITWSAFTADGYQLKQMLEKDIVWNEVSATETNKLIPHYEVSHPVVTGSNEFEDILLNKVKQRNFPVSHYNKGTKLFNFHSWRPYYSDPEFTFSLYGENVLNTFQTELYYLYNQDEKTNAVGFNAVYGAWFPYLNLGTEYTFDRQGVIANGIRHWSQLDSRIGLSIPLSFTSGQTFKNFNLGSYYVLRNQHFKDYDSIGGNGTFSYLQHFISWSQQIQQAVQHIYPRFGYAFSATHRYAITNYKGYQFIGNASLYLPGLLSAHSIVVTGSFQQRDTLNQLFSNQFAYSRGYEGRYFSRMWRLSGNYHLPLLYPDWGFGNILYLQRVRANAFYDFTKVYSADKIMTRNQRSVGGEIFIDTRWWNQYPLTFGFRVSRLLDRDQFNGFKGTVFEFVLPVSIIPQ